MTTPPTYLKPKHFQAACEFLTHTEAHNVGFLLSNISHDTFVFVIKLFEQTSCWTNTNTHWVHLHKYFFCDDNRHFISTVNLSNTRPWAPTFQQQPDYVIAPQPILKIQQDSGIHIGTIYQYQSTTRSKQLFEISNRVLPTQVQVIQQRVFANSMWTFTLSKMWTANTRTQVELNQTLVPPIFNIELVNNQPQQYLHDSYNYKLLAMAFIFKLCDLLTTANLSFQLIVVE